MATESKYKNLLSKVHQGVPLEKPAEKVEKKEKNETKVKPVDETPDVPPAAQTGIREEIVESVIKPAGEITESVNKAPDTTIRPAEKRRRKPQADYQSLFFNRIDFTHRKPLYITANTHRRLMRIVHLMDESKATISSYVENIILNHLETFREEIDTIYRTNNINPTE